MVLEHVWVEQTGQLYVVNHVFLQLENVLKVVYAFQIEVALLHEDLELVASLLLSALVDQTKPQSACLKHLLIRIVPLLQLAFLVLRIYSLNFAMHVLDLVPDHAGSKEAALVDGLTTSFKDCGVCWVTQLEQFGHVH